MPTAPSEEVLEAQLYRATLAYQDFKEAEAYLGAFRARDKVIVRQALLKSAVVAYCRPFSNNGSRDARAAPSLPSGFLRNYDPSHRLLHERLRTLRNNALAHSNFERNRPRRVDRLRTDRLLIVQKVFELLREGIDVEDFLSLTRAAKKHALRSMREITGRLYGAKHGTVVLKPPGDVSGSAGPLQPP